MNKRMTEKAFLEKLGQGLYKNSTAALGALGRIHLYPKDKARLKEIVDWFFTDEELRPEWKDGKPQRKEALRKDEFELLKDLFRNREKKPGFGIVFYLASLGISESSTLAVIEELRRRGEDV